MQDRKGCHKNGSKMEGNYKEVGEGISVIGFETQHLGCMIRAAREYRGLSQVDLARLCQLSPKSLSLVETGQRNFLWCTLLQVLKELRFNVVFCPVGVELASDHVVEVLLRMAQDIQELSILLNKREIKQAKDG